MTQGQMTGEVMVKSYEAVENLIWSKNLEWVSNNLQ